MNQVRIALANVKFPESPEVSIAKTIAAIEAAALRKASIVCFPECYVPGYRAVGKAVLPPDQAFLDRAWSRIADAAKIAKVSVVLGTERVLDNKLLATALFIRADGTIEQFQDKVQIDPSEEAIYEPGTGRRVFRSDNLTFGIVICHEGWRYPETVRHAAQLGAQVVFHLQFHEAEPDSYRPTAYGDPANTFHEKAVLCRAAENTCFFATINYASEGSPTTSAIVGPDGTLLAYQPYGEEGLLVADLDLSLATGLLAARCKAPY